VSKSGDNVDEEVTNFRRAGIWDCFADEKLRKFALTSDDPAVSL
jgi:hypothetical protein